MHTIVWRNIVNIANFMLNHGDIVVQMTEMAFKEMSFRI